MLLDVRAVTRRYILSTEVVVALREVDFQLSAGELVAVMGPSGSGKTTLLNLLAGLDRPSSGRILWKGKDLNELGERERASWRRREIGLVFQDASLMSGLTAFDNARLPLVLSGAGQEEDRLAALFERLGMSDKAGRLPGQLSRGERHRVAVARALANRPACLIADEPTGNLDRDATKKMFALFRELAEEGLGVAIATHDEAVLGYATRKVALIDGRMDSGGGT